MSKAFERINPWWILHVLAIRNAPYWVLQYTKYILFKRRAKQKVQGKLLPAKQFDTGLRSWAETLFIACIDEAQQFGEEREVAAAALLPPACILLFTGDPFQTPGGIARNVQAFETRQCLLKTPHGLRSTQDARLPAELSGKLHSLLKASDHQDAAVICEFLKQRTRPYQGMFAPMEPDEGEHDPGMARFSSVPTRYPDHLLEGTRAAQLRKLSMCYKWNLPW